MNENDLQRWPALQKDDEGLQEELLTLLSRRVEGDPYSDDGSFASALKDLPSGLRAMAATHWLDISLTLDSVTWHFGNFGEPGLVIATEEGLRELGLEELAQVFCEARDLMVPLLAPPWSPEAGDPDEILERNGLSTRGDELDNRAWNLHKTDGGGSVIYDAWVRYARQHPDQVFAE